MSLIRKQSLVAEKIHTHLHFSNPLSYWLQFAKVAILRSPIEVMGGQLAVVARFPDGAVKIGNVADLGSAARA